MTRVRLSNLLCMSGLLLAAQSIHAAEDACTAQIESAIKQAYPTAQQTNRGYRMGETIIQLLQSGMPNQAHAVICRTWPAHPELTLMAVPLIKEQNPEFGDYVGDLELFVLESNSSTSRQRLRLSGRMSDDAVRITSVAFDTAHYQLAPGQIAFGLRIGKEGSSRPNPFGETGLWLYAIESNQLKAVMDGVVVTGYGGEWDTNCVGTFSQTQRTLAMASAVHNGYADISVSETHASSTNTLDKNGDCNTREAKPRRTTYRLTYDGKRYVVPKALGPIE